MGVSFKRYYGADYIGLNSEFNHGKIFNKSFLLLLLSKIQQQNSSHLFALFALNKKIFIKNTRWKHNKNIYSMNTNTVMQLVEK